MPETVTAPREINGDPAFPIYSVTLEYEYRDPDPDDGDSEVQTRGQNTELMYREEPSTEQLVNDVWSNFQHNRDVRIEGSHTHEAGEYAYLYEPVSPLRFKVESFFYEAWSLSWFGHHTYPLGRSDDELLSCFSRYVSRHLPYGRVGYDYPYDDPPTVHVFEDGVEVPARSTLMGAEDHWRWHGTEQGRGGHDAKKTDPPCRCEHCQEQEVVRIGH